VPGGTPIFDYDSRTTATTTTTTTTTSRKYSQVCVIFIPVLTYENYSKMNNFKNKFESKSRRGVQCNFITIALV
jgi:hypothetical protein